MCWRRAVTVAVIIAVSLAVFVCVINAVTECVTVGVSVAVMIVIYPRPLQGEMGVDRVGRGVCDDEKLANCVTRDVLRNGFCHTILYSGPYLNYGCF